MHETLLNAVDVRAAKMLASSAEAGATHLLVIEEAHSLPEATLKHLKRLHEMRLGRKPLLGILLLGQTELGQKLDPRRANLREVTQRCEVVNLLPLDGDLRSYLEHRTRATGHDLSKLIDQTGIDEIRTRLTISRPVSGGKSMSISLLYPLAVNNLLTIIEKDRAWNEDAARAQLLKVFEAAGFASDVAKTGRRRLSKILFS